MSYKGRTICNVHDGILDSLKSIIKEIDRVTRKDLPIDIDWLEREVEWMIDQVNIAKDMGQRMENAIRTRRGAIEDACRILQDSL